MEFSFFYYLGSFFRFVLNKARKWRNRKKGSEKGKRTVQGEQACNEEDIKLSTSTSNITVTKSSDNVTHLLNFFPFVMRHLPCSKFLLKRI